MNAPAPSTPPPRPPPPKPTPKRPKKTPAVPVIQIEVGKFVVRFD